MKWPELKARLAALRTELPTKRAALETLALNGVLAITVAMLANAARERREGLAESEARLSAVQAIGRDWPRRHVPATPTERQQWASAQVDLARLGLPAANRLYVAQILSRRAEDAGIPDARIRFTGADTIGAASTRILAGQEFKPAGYAVSVEFTANFATAVEFIAQLPAAVSIASVQLKRQEERVHARFLLTVYESPESGT
ncbi:MAG: hypothetical protein ACT4O1_09560 [Gemmatimonadota bacterium]